MKASGTPGRIVLRLISEGGPAREERRYYSISLATAGAVPAGRRHG
jgi:hypothetical protein